MMCLKHISLLEKYKSNQACLNLSKKHINYYIKNFNDSSNIRKKLMRYQNIESIKKELTEMKEKYYAFNNSL